MLILGDCVVCHEPLTEKLAVVRCGHVYHNDCIVPWIRGHNNCPMCRHYCKVRNINKVHVEDDGIDWIKKCEKLTGKLEAVENQLLLMRQECDILVEDLKTSQTKREELKDKYRQLKIDLKTSQAQLQKRRRSDPPNPVYAVDSLIQVRVVSPARKRKQMIASPVPSQGIAKKRRIASRSSKSLCD